MRNVRCYSHSQRSEWFILEVAGITFSDSDSAPVPKFLNPVWNQVRQFFKFENPTPVQTPDTIINPTVIYPCFYLRYDHTEIEK